MEDKVTKGGTSRKAKSVKAPASTAAKAPAAAASRPAAAPRKPAGKAAATVEAPAAAVKAPAAPVKAPAAAVKAPADAGKAAAPRKVPEVSAAVQPAGGGGPDREHLIRLEAYFRAEQRGFAPGSELEDWLAAEAAVSAKLTST